MRPSSYEAPTPLCSLRGGYAHLYGEGKVDYPHERIELTAGRHIHEHGQQHRLRSRRGGLAGVLSGKPVFTEGDTPYETNTIRYNFKSKKGIISDVVSQQGEAYVTGNNAKKGASDELFMRNGRYTTATTMSIRTSTCR